MQEQARLGDKNQPHVVQIMTTEHYNLQSARSLATSEAAGRSSLFLSTVTTTLVALALVAQISALGTAFFVFALVLFPSLFFLGLVTFQRTFQIDLEDFRYTRGINRIRHLYVEIAPQVQDYFVLSTHDDNAGTRQNMQVQAIWWQAFVSTPGMIGVIDSILAGIFAGLLVYQLFSLSLLLCCTVSLVVFLGILAALYRYALTTWRRLLHSTKPLFPTPVQVE